MAIEYETLTPDEFDAVVTGELTHYAILFENRINDFLVSYLGILKSRSDIFKRLFLYRDDLRLQDKIEITKAVIRHHSAYLKQPGPKSIDVDRALRLLKEVETFKAVRNALAHGLSVRKSEEEDTPTLHVEIITRSGKENQFQITPTSHRAELQ